MPNRISQQPTKPGVRAEADCSAHCPLHFFPTKDAIRHDGSSHRLSEVQGISKLGASFISLIWPPFSPPPSEFSCKTARGSSSFSRSTPSSSSSSSLSWSSGG